MKHRTAMASVICLLSIFAFTGCSTVLTHPNFEKRGNEIKTVTVVPSDVLITRVTFNGDDETLYAESAAATETLQRALETQMASKGYEVVPFEMNENDEEMKAMIGKLKDQYTTLVSQKAALKKKNFAPSLGSDINLLADHANVDALAFYSAAGYVKSGGEIAKDVTKTVLIAAATLGNVVYITPHFGGGGVISLVDGDNGDILWHNFSSNGSAYNLTDPKHVETLPRQVLAPFPKRKAWDEEAEIDPSKQTGGRPVSINVPMKLFKYTAQASIAITHATAEAAGNVVGKAIGLTVSVPRESAALVKLGINRAEHGQYDEAIAAYKAALKTNKKNAQLNMLIGQAYLAKGDLKNAEKYGNKSLKLDNKLQETHELMAEIYTQKGDAARAEEHRAIYQPEVTVNTVPPPVLAA